MLVGTYQDSEGGGEGHCSPPLANGNLSWRGSVGADSRGRRLLGGALERWFARPRATSCFVGQSLAFCANQSAIGALQIVDAKSDPVVVSEIKLCGIPV